MSLIGAHVLFGHAPEGLLPLMEAGLEELSHDTRQDLITGVERAQAALRDQCVQAAFASGRAQYICPPTVAELLDYPAHCIKIKKESSL